MSQRRPQDLVFTLFGDYLLHRPEPVWVGSLIALLEPLGLSSGAVRTVLSRMSRKGWFDTQRRGRWSFYELTARGRRLLEEGEARIYDPPRPEPWPGGWTLLAYSIPEERRHLRDGLRSRLSWLGFGSLGNGLWISPHEVEEEVRDVAATLDVTDHLEVFRALHVGFSDLDRLVGQCWDLPEINASYGDFIAGRRPELQRCRQGLAVGSLTEEECFVRRFDLIHEYREFFLVDPLLPRSLLPDDWRGEEAGELFRAYHDLLVEPADRFVDSVLAEAPGIAVEAVG
jgi:phenylacetic acid degradation operon negative regulatory protein